MSANNNNHGMVLGVLGGTLSGTHNAVDVADVALIGGGNWNNFGTQLTKLEMSMDNNGFLDHGLPTVHLFTGNIFAVE